MKGEKGGGGGLRQVLVERIPVQETGQWVEAIAGWIPSLISSSRIRLEELVLAQPPFLTPFDPDGREEYRADWLTLQAIGERTAERTYPLVTCKMSTIRFPTAMIAGAVGYEDVGEAVASDGETPAWPVFKWNIVQALMMQREELPPADAWGARR